MPGIDGVVMKDVVNEFDRPVKVIVSSVLPLYEQKKRIPAADDYFDKDDGTELLIRKIRCVLSNG